MNYKFYLQFKDQRLYEEVIALVLRYSLSGYMVDYHISTLTWNYYYYLYHDKEYFGIFVVLPAFH